ncbi:interferon-induced, double-stranded RNA-activated protein kinase isoform X1 [Podarcis raffonei]|uniref:interferon-induced, double-stranded RNA-activated protein kinase isoform X1 n=1 Tax=Podarcis raffonei TaxID=65483 RepID=UPI0023292DAE|nr:interferon-induced, double-stranded RNA-activated protein kinase isoform X1 [Podarcis raffonei]
MADNQAVPRIYMAKLNEYCQRRRLRLDYKDLGFDGPSHNPVFTVAVEIDGRQYSQATGKSKKEAKDRAAFLAWESIERELPADPVLRPEQPLPPLPSPQYPVLRPEQPLPPLSSPLSQSPEPAANLAQPASSLNYLALLNEYSSRNKVVVQYVVVSKSGLDHMPIFHCVCKIDDKDFGEGTGNNKQTAKRNAARQAYEKLNDQATSRAERSAFLPNSSTNSSRNPLHSNSQESSPEASGTSAEEAVDLASNKSDSIIFRSSGIYSNGTDRDSSCNHAADKLANQFGAIQLNEASPSCLASPKGSAVRPKKRETPLAPKFSKLNRKQSKYTINEKFLDEFEDIQKIKSGGYGTVFKAKHFFDDRLLAVKRVKLLVGEEESKKEVQALAKLEHEYIVRYYNCWIGKDNIPSPEDSDQRVEADCLFIVMEYCEKGTLKDWISKECAKESYHEDAKIKFQQIVEGVAYIHSQNLIHRDLKPINILMSRDNKIKIGDFGLVTTGVDDHSVQRTEKRGTVLYMAPEQVGNKYGKEVDIFPLGLILFEMLYTFQTYHEKHERFENIKKGEFPEPFTKEFPEEVSLIKKLLSKVPSDRPSAPAILHILKKRQYSPHTC